MANNGKSFQMFLDSRDADLHRIARGSRGDCSIDDVSNEAYLIAADIECKRGYAVDFSNRDDQELVLGWLYRALVTFADKRLRYAVRLDRKIDPDDSGSSATLIEYLEAPEHSDPLVHLQAEEEQLKLLKLTKHSYSQYSAYIILMYRFEWDLEALAETLRLVASTVQKKILACRIHMGFQPSMFDSVQQIAANFEPTVARIPIRSHLLDSGQQQLEWDFV